MIINSSGSDSTPSKDPCFLKSNELEIQHRNSQIVDTKKNHITKFISAIPQFNDPNQKKALQYFIRFLALILILTIIARGTSGATMAQVETCQLSIQEIVEYVEVSGKVESIKKYIPKIPDGITIEQITVVPGQIVKQGDIIGIIDMDKLQSQLSQEKIKLKTMELNLSKLQRGEPYINSELIAAQYAYDWALQDIANKQTAGQTAIDSANDKLERANKELQVAQENYDTVKNNPDATSEEISEATEKLSTANTAVATAKNDLQAAKTTSQQSNQDAERNSESARLRLESQQQSDQKARLSAEDIRAQNALDAESLKIDIMQQNDDIELLTQFSSENIVSEISGTVLSIGVEGKLTSSSEPMIVVSDSSAGFRVSGMISIDKATPLYSGMQAEIRTTSGYQEILQNDNATLLSISEPVNETSVRAIFNLPGTNWKQDENVDLFIMLNRETYDCCVPISAIHQNNTGFYVYVIDQANGVLGTENVIRRVSVELLASNESHAAVNGALTNNDVIVASTTKPISIGDKVRVI